MTVYLNIDSTSAFNLLSEKQSLWDSIVCFIYLIYKKTLHLKNKKFLKGNFF